MGVVIDDPWHEDETLRIDCLSRGRTEQRVAKRNDQSVTNSDITPLRWGARAVVHLGIPNLQVKHVSTSGHCNIGIVTKCCLIFGSCR
jgi:hypothetical protein